MNEARGRSTCRPGISAPRRPRCPHAGIIAVLALGLLTGCRPPEPAGVSASGSVRAGGEPLSGAVITLEPLAGTPGPSGSAPIFDGQFEIASHAGLHPGRYRVRISMIPLELRRQLPPPQQANLPPEDAVIAPRFDGDSTLTCRLSDRSDNELRFEIDFL